MPTDPFPLASELIAESLHGKIQIVPRAARLLEHKLRGEALLSVSNILSIIHKEEEKIKRCWLVLKKGTWLLCWHRSYIWPNVFFFYLLQLWEIYISRVIYTVHVFVLIWTKQMIGIISHPYQICCQLMQITLLVYYNAGQLLCNFYDWTCHINSVFFRHLCLCSDSERKESNQIKYFILILLLIQPFSLWGLSYYASVRDLIKWLLTSLLGQTLLCYMCLRYGFQHSQLLACKQLLSQVFERLILFLVLFFFPLFSLPHLSTHRASLCFFLKPLGMVKTIGSQFFTIIY